MINPVKLRQKIVTQIDRLPPERLALVSEFLDSLQSLETIHSSPVRKLPPIKRGNTAQDLLKFAATWQGDDLEKCLNFVNESRSKTQF